MSMLRIHPFDTDLSRFMRGKLYDAGRQIERTLKANGIEGGDALILKAVARKLVHSGIFRSADGVDVLDKATKGVKVSSLHSVFKNDQETVDKNLHAKAVMIGFFGDFDHFDAALMAAGKPQIDAFLIEASHELEALDEICRSIAIPYEILVNMEENFDGNVRLYREFENKELGHIYPYQQIKDPFLKREPETASTSIDCDPHP